jgi:hypothetical protein
LIAPLQNGRRREFSDQNVPSKVSPKKSIIKGKFECESEKNEDIRFQRFHQGILAKHSDIIRRLKEGQSVRNTAKITGKGGSTVQRVKTALAAIV